MTVARAQGQARRAAQASAAAWARATARREGPSWRTASLLPLLRAAAPAHHKGAAADVVDVAFVARCRALGGDALLSAGAVHVVAARDRSARVSAGAPEFTLSLPRVDDGVLWVAGLALEAAKLQHGLGARPDDLKAHFDTPHTARAALSALATGGLDRVVTLVDAEPRATPPELQRATAERPVVIVAGALAARVHDLLSPQPRRLRRELLAAVPVAHRAGDDAVYAALQALHQEDAGAHAERVLAEAKDGLVSCGDVVVALCDRLQESLADRRLGLALQQAKRARAAFVLCAHDADLDVALAAFPTAVVCAGVFGTAAAAPRAVVDVATDHVTLVDNLLAGAQAVSRSAPTPLLWSAGADEHDEHEHTPHDDLPLDDAPLEDAGGFALLQRLHRAVADGLRDHARVAFITAPLDDPAQSSAALTLVQAAVASLEPRPRRR